MKSNIRIFCAIYVFMTSLIFAHNSFASQFADRPLIFVANEGQWEDETIFIAQKDKVAARFTRKGFDIRLEKSHAQDQREGILLRFQPEGISSDLTLVGRNQLKGTYNYFLGDNHQKWKTDVPTFESIIYKGIYEGINLVVRSDANQIAYDILLEPNADLDQLKIGVKGIKELKLAEDGSLIMETELGSISQTPPQVWYELPSGEKQPVDAQFQIIDQNHYGFVVPERNNELALVIDPTLDWASFLGTGVGDEINDIVVDPDTKEIIATGGTELFSAFPMTPGAFVISSASAPVAFITRFSSDGSTLVYSALIGGAGVTESNDIALTSSGDVVIGGITHATDFPTTPGAYSSIFSGFGEIFVTRLSADGSSLVFSTGIGMADFFDGLAIGSQEDIFITGAVLTGFSVYPTTTGAFSTVPFGSYDGLITRLSSDGSSLIYSTYIGGSDKEFLYDLVVDQQNQAIITGRTESSDFPTTTGVVNENCVKLSIFSTCNIDIFVTKLNAQGTGLIYSTYLGGTSTDWPYKLALDSQEQVVVAGYTLSPNINPFFPGEPVFPITPGAFDEQFDNPQEGFVLKLNTDATGIVFSTYLGGTQSERIKALAVTPIDSVVVGGHTDSNDFPLTMDAYINQYIGGGVVTGPFTDVWPIGDGFISHLSPDGKNLWYSTYMGGNSTDEVLAIASDDLGSIYVGGYTFSSDLPIPDPNVFMPTYQGGLVLPCGSDCFFGGGDGYVLDFDLTPTGIDFYGNASGACPELPNVDVIGNPEAGNSYFSFVTDNIKPNTPGVLFLSTGSTSGINVSGITLFIDPSQIFRTINFVTNSEGSIVTNVPIPSTIPSGFQAYAQYAFGSGIGCNNFVASEGVSVTIQ